MLLASMNEFSLSNNDNMLPVIMTIQARKHSDTDLYYLYTEPNIKMAQASH